MTGDLVERLRDPRGFDWGDFYELCQEAADRIEFLEGTVKTGWVNWEELWAHSQKQRDRIEALEKEVEELDQSGMKLVSERDALVKALKAILEANEDSDEIAINSIARAALGGEE